MPRKLENGFLLFGGSGPYNTLSSPITLPHNYLEPVTAQIVDQKYFANNRHAISKPWAPDDPYQPMMYAFQNKCCHVIEAELYTRHIGLQCDEYILPVRVLNSRYRQ
jgi:hypothetical protein